MGGLMGAFYAGNMTRREVGAGLALFPPRHSAAAPLAPFTEKSKKSRASAQAPRRRCLQPAVDAGRAISRDWTADPGAFLGNKAQHREDDMTRFWSAALVL